MSPSRRNSLNNGMLGMLCDGHYGETINSMITKLYKKADFDVEKAQRGIVFLDGLDKLCSNSSRAGEESARQQVFKEILKIVQGTWLDVSRLVDSGISLNEAGVDIPDEDVEPPLRTVDKDGEFLDTSGMFFVCFGGPPDGFERAEEKDKDEGVNDPIIQSPSSERLARLANDKKNDTTNLKLSSGHYSGEDGSGDDDSNYTLQARLRGSQTSLVDKKEDKKDPGDGPGGGGGVEKSKKSSMKDLDDYYEDDGYDDEYYDDLYEEEEEESKQLTRLLKVCEADLHEANSKFRECQKMWGMKDIQFEFADGALEMIAYQALCQNTGEDGISNILEKLFMNIKFDIPGGQFGTKVSKIEITEQAVMGKERAKYHFDVSKRRSSSLDSGYSSIASSVTTTKTLNVISGSNAKYHRRASTNSTWSNHSSSSYYHRNITADLTPIREEAKPIAKYIPPSDFDQNIYDELEL